jgi:prepilin-type N-terminal cleavage/methylation domain-containing protein
MYRWAKQKQTGFTIVELLIVIVVIAILATISIVAYNGVQQRARDNIRRADINAIAKSLELLYTDKGMYRTTPEPCSDTSVGIDTGCSGVLDDIDDWDATSNIRNLITEGYTATIPVDPLNTTTYYYSYEPWNAGQGGYTEHAQAYDLCARLEAGGTYCVNKRR